MKEIIIISAILLIFLIVLIWTIVDNKSIEITNTKYKNSKIPKEFEGYKIVQISDLHNKRFGENQSKLAEKIKSCNPDIIVITGDLIDKSVDEMESVTELINQIIETAPIYYVAGNHEVYTNQYETIKQKLIEAKVIVLDNESFILSKDGQSINLIGLIDPEFYYSPSSKENNLRLNDKLKKLSNSEYFQILLTHRPELMNYYVENNIDLVFAGHTHGGQIRFPIVGGIIAPNQGFFPKYISGEYVEKDTTLIINRGLGATRIPFRVLNRPEIVLVELQSEEEI